MLRSLKDVPGRELPGIPGLGGVVVQTERAYVVHGDLRELGVAPVAPWPCAGARVVVRAGAGLAVSHPDWCGCMPF